MTSDTPEGFTPVLGLEPTGELIRRPLDDESILAAADLIRKARRAGEKGGIIRWSSRYATVFQEGAEFLAAAKELPASAHRVLWALLASAPYDGTEFPSQPEKIRAMCGLSQPSHAVATRRLLDAGIIERPRPGWLRFDPAIAWRGSAASREVALAEKIASATGAGRTGA